MRFRTASDQRTTLGYEHVKLGGTCSSTLRRKRFLEPLLSRQVLHLLRRFSRPLQIQVKIVPATVASSNAQAVQVMCNRLYIEDGNAVN